MFVDEVDRIANLRRAADNEVAAITSVLVTVVAVATAAVAIGAAVTAAAEGADESMENSIGLLCACEFLCLSG
jgi:hypothetical protein